MSFTDGAGFRALIISLAFLIALQLILAATGAVLRARDIPDFEDRPMAAQAQAAVSMIERLPREAREEAAMAFSSPFVLFRLIDSYPEHELAGEPLAAFRPIISNIRSVLGEREFHVYRRRTARWFLGRDAEDRLIGTEMLIVIRLDDGSGLVIEPSAVYQRHVLMTFTAVASAILGVLLLGALVWAALATARPLREMADAADRLALDLNAPPMPEQGPRTVRELAGAFNRMQAELRASVSERMRTLAAVAHDMRTYLTRLRMRAEFITDDDQRTKALRDLNEMAGIIDDTLVLARSEDAAAETGAVDVAALMREIAAERVELGHKVSLHVTTSGEGLARGARAGVKRALANLVDNAIRYGEAAYVTVNGRDGMVCVSVLDDGPGVPFEEIAKLTEPFYRLETSRSRETGGSGLGLTIAKTVAERAGGALVLENAAEEGFVARLCLPRAEE